MLGLFAAKPNHPLADIGEARRVAADLTRLDPKSAVTDACAWLESLMSAEGFKLPMLVERLMLLEGAAVPQARRLGRDYLKAGLNAAASATLWKQAQEFWHLLARAHEACIVRLAKGGKENDLGKELVPLVFASALHARAATQKWNQFLYRSVPDGFWAAVGAQFRAANDLGVARRQVELYPGHGTTTVEAEYLKLLLFHVAAMDTLSPVQVELGERLIAHFLAQFALTREVRPENVYWVDAASGLPPARLARVPEVTPTLYFFTGTQALLAVDDLNSRIKSALEVPASVNLGGQYPAAEVAEVLQHLAECWAPKPPMRVHVRRPVVAPIAITHGFANALQTIAYAVASSRTKVAALEVWSASDVSLGGMAIHGPLGREDWPRIGALVAVLPEGGSNWLVGIVRRVSRGIAEAGEEAWAAPADKLADAAGRNTAYLGVETISKSARAVVADEDGLPVDAIVLDLPVVGEYARMVVPPNSLEDNIALTFTLYEKLARLHPREIVERGPDFIVANFFVQSYS